MRVQAKALRIYFLACYLLVSSGIQRSSSFLNLGRYNCVGKGLALAELGFVIALLVSKYDINFASGKDGSRVLGDLRNQFTAAPVQLMFRFAKRKAGYIRANV